MGHSVKFSLASASEHKLVSVLVHEPCGYPAAGVEDEVAFYVPAWLAKPGQHPPPGKRCRGLRPGCDGTPPYGTRALQPP